LNVFGLADPKRVALQAYAERFAVDQTDEVVFDPFDVSHR
jgi:hypothetical protein